MKKLTKSDLSLFSTDEANIVLDRVIGFVENCDSKASIMLGFIGILLTISFPSGFLDSYILVVNSTLKFASKLDIFLLILLLIPILLLVICVYKLVSSLYANTKLSGYDSKIYFVDIAENANNEVFSKKVSQMSEEDYLEDILHQIHINSTICSRKYKSYNQGFKYGAIGLSLFIILCIITNLIQMGGSV